MLYIICMSGKYNLSDIALYLILWNFSKCSNYCFLFQSEDVALCLVKCKTVLSVTFNHSITIFGLLEIKFSLILIKQNYSNKSKHNHNKQGLIATRLSVLPCICKYPTICKYILTLHRTAYWFPLTVGGGGGNHPPPEFFFNGYFVVFYDTTL